MWHDNVLLCVWNYWAMTEGVPCIVDRGPQMFSHDLQQDAGNVSTHSHSSTTSLTICFSLTNSTIALSHFIIN